MLAIFQLKECIAFSNICSMICGRLKGAGMPIYLTVWHGKVPYPKLVVHSTMPWCHFSQLETIGILSLSYRAVLRFAMLEMSYCTLLVSAGHCGPHCLTLCNTNICNVALTTAQRQPWCPLQYQSSVSLVWITVFHNAKSLPEHCVTNWVKVDRCNLVETFSI